MLQAWGCSHKPDKGSYSHAAVIWCVEGGEVREGDK